LIAALTALATAGASAMICHSVANVLDRPDSCGPIGRI
jgi:hypothetical protein